MMLLSKLHLAFLGIESTSWLCAHENGLLEIFLMVCETSEAGFSGQDARRQQMSCAAAACCAVVAEWRALLRHTSPALEPPLLA